MSHLRSTKMLGLAVVAATAFMAFAGAGTASATSLCKSSTSPCPTAETYAVGTAFTGTLKTGTKAKLEAGPVTDECSTSEVKGKSTKAGTPLTGEISALTFSNCTCTESKAINLPWTAKINATGGGNGTLEAESSGKGSPGGQVTCSGLTCKYESAKAKGVTITGDTPAIAKANVELEVKSGGLCVFGGNAHWIAEYVLSPSPLFVTALP